MSTTIGSYNVNGIANPRKRREVFNWLKEKNYDIICLQETHSSPEHEMAWKQDWHGEVFFNHGTTNQRGVLILCKENLKFTINNCSRDDDGRLLIIDISINDLNFCICNLYAPNRDNPDFFDNIEKLMSNYNHGNFIIVGDFNTVQNAKLDRAGRNPAVYHPNAQQKINDLMFALELVDVWRYKHPNTVRFTWRRGKQASRLDYFLVSFSLLADISNVRILDRLKSDHKIISLHIQTVKHPRGRNYWKFNQTLLTDVNFQQKTEEFIDEFFRFNTGTSDPLTVWDTFKCCFRGHTISFASKKRKEFISKENDIKKHIEKLNEKLDETDEPSQTVLDELSSLQSELEILYEQKSDQMFYKQRADWMEFSDRCTKQFLDLGRRNSSKKNVINLKTTDGENIQDPKRAIEEIKSFYHSLYSFSDPPKDLDDENCEPFFPGDLHVHLDTEQKNSCEGLITEKELWEAIDSFKEGKTPGIDGIPVEVYKTFFRNLKNPMLHLFNHAYESGNLSDSQKEGLITLLLKQDSNGEYKDPTALNNWRPLSLLCCDVRILSKVISLRIRKVISNLIHKDQCGFLQNRFIGENICQITEIIQLYEKEKLPGMIFIADFEKAFDKLRWDFMFRALQFFGFGESFIRWVSVLYKDITSKVINNGYISTPFKLSRGVRQGCPLSPYLFILCVELLAVKIRSNNNIKGITLHETEIKVSQFADDSNFPLQPTLTSLLALTKDLNNFSEISGLDPNYSKCKILRIGTLRNTHFTLPCNLPVQWTDGPVKMLGVGITGDTNKLTKNYEDRLIKIDRTLLPWKMIPMSLYGKVTLINTLVVSQFTHLFMSLPSPEKSFFQRYEQKVFRFIWNGKPEKIKRKVIYNTYDKGGLGLIHLPTFDRTRKASWVPRMFCQHNSNRKPLLDTSSVVFSRHLYPFLQLSLDDITSMRPLCTISPFFKDVLKAWLSLQYKPPETYKDIQNQIIWCNSNILVESKPIALETPMSCGMIHINDILDLDGKLLSYDDVIKKFGKVIGRMGYNSIVSAIPNDWKKELLKHSPTVGPIIPSAAHYIWLKTCRIHKKTYSFFLQKNNIAMSPTNIQSYWEDEFNVPLPWHHIFKLIYKTTISPRLRILQYKIVHKTLATRKMLHRWKIADSPLCVHCKLEEETIRHIFWECPRVHELWTKTQKWLESIFLQKYNFDAMNVIMGEFRLDHPPILNMIILLAKNFIMHNNQQHLSMKQFMNIIKTHEHIEYIIAVRKQKLNYHLKKWETLRLALFPTVP